MSVTLISPPTVKLILPPDIHFIRTVFSGRVSIKTKYLHMMILARNNSPFNFILFGLLSGRVLNKNKIFTYDDFRA